jgi:hypothetical protein
MKSEDAVRAFYEEHRERFQKISDRQWQEDYRAADPYTKMTMVALKDYERFIVDFFTDGTGKLARICEP